MQCSRGILLSSDDAFRWDCEVYVMSFEVRRLRAGSGCGRCREEVGRSLAFWHLDVFWVLVLVWAYTKNRVVVTISNLVIG